MDPHPRTRQGRCHKGSWSGAIPSCAPGNVGVIVVALLHKTEPKRIRKRV